MSMINEFSETAKSLARNPLGIIALFIVLIYGFASLVVGASDKLQPNERYPIVWFLVTFPVIVLGTFAWLVSRHYEKLYAPKDYSTDEAFLRGIERSREGRPALHELEKQIEFKVREVLTSDEMTSNTHSSGELKEKLLIAADKITREIRNSSFITIDARKLTKSGEAIFELPVGAISTFGELGDEIYFLIQKYVRPFEYGYTWALKDPNTNEIIKNARMITKSPPGVPLKDTRSLEEVGIKAGMTLEIIQP